MAAPAFELLARPIQHALWEMGWTELRPIQADAIREVIQTDHDLIISARTASGKTEAAFLPILSRLFETAPRSVGAVYVGPLKALINDQFRRLEDLCERAEIPVHRWHGDVDAGKKDKLIKQPGGVLLITPESIESLFVNRSFALERLFSQLSFVVIDEIHSLIGRERGLQLRSQLFRIRRYTVDPFRVVALSATIGDAVDLYRSWVRPEAPGQVTLIHDPGEQKQVQFRIEAYFPDPPKPRNHIAEADTPAEETPPARMLQDMLTAFCGRKNLIFCNDRASVEWLADGLNEVLQRSGRPAEFLVHHGSLSHEIRQFTEEEMRGARPATAVCSSTLELGIDIGRLAAVGQVGPPWSVNSLVQRLGRSGRGEGEPHSMRVYLEVRPISSDSGLDERLYPDLLQAIAASELMRRRWVEPPNLAELDLSTLVQQLLSALGETGGEKAASLYQRIVRQGAFPTIDLQRFAEILRCLGRKGAIEQMGDGRLLLAPDGERLIHDRDFYSAFMTPVEMAVRAGGRPIGTLSALFIPRTGDHLLLGGRRWQVESIDVERKEVLVVPAKGRKKPSFTGSGGEIHPKLRDEMRCVLLADDDYAYLGPVSRELLVAAREAARQAELHNQSFVLTSEGSCLWFTWTGTRIQRTLLSLARRAGLEAADRKIALAFEVGPAELLGNLESLRNQGIESWDLAADMPVVELKKFDPWLDRELLIAAVAADFFDLDGAWQLAEKLRESAARLGIQPMTVLPPMDESPEDEMSGEISFPFTTAVGHVDNRPLVGCEFVAFDLETTGLHPLFSQIVELAAVRFSVDGRELDRFEQLIDPRQPIPPEASAIHGIRDSDVFGKPTLGHALPRFLEFLGPEDNILLAHNAEFDQSVLAVALCRWGVAGTAHAIVDTLPLAQALLPELPNYRLETIAHRLQVPIQPNHRALADAIAVQGVFLSLINHRDRMPLHLDTICDLFELAGCGHLLAADSEIDCIPEELEDLRDALANKSSVLLLYEGGTRGRGLHRVTPLAILSSGGKTYLSAHCHVSDSTRSFRLDRIRRVQPDA